VISETGFVPENLQIYAEPEPELPLEIDGAPAQEIPAADPADVQEVTSDANEGSASGA
jgi:hypothetical protein